MRRLGILMALAFGLVGCGPKPTPGGPGADAGKLEGVWMISKAEGPPSMPPPKDDELGKMVVTVKGNLITARRQGDPYTQYMVFEVDEAANPKVITLIPSDEKGDVGPVKVFTPMTAPAGGKFPPPEEKFEPRPKIKGIYTLDGDTLKVAICTEPGLPPPADFTPKDPAVKEWKPDAKPGDRAATVVVHLTRQKEAPAWVNDPPPASTPTTKPVAPPPPPSAPKGK